MAEIRMPVPAGFGVTSPFGQRWGQLHAGIDYGTPVGTPIYAIADGEVVEGKDRTGVSGFGSWIWIDCQASIGRDLIYGHVVHDKILVRAGDRVKAGQQIGVSGNEGDTTGPHLHFETWTAPGRVGGTAVDPAPLLAQAGKPVPAPAPSEGTPMALVADTAGGYPSPAGLKQAGINGIVLYVSGSRPGSNFAGKKLTRAVLQNYIANGIACAPVWQFGKPGSSVGSDWRGGYDRGFKDALAARGKWFECGGPGWTPIYFAVDEDISLNDWNNIAVNYFKGACAAIGKDWVGIYGHSRVCDWAKEDGVIGGRNGKFWMWQCRAWSGTEIHKDAVLYQRVIDTPSAPGPKVDGITIDVNDVKAADWGQTGINRAPAGIPNAPTTPPTTQPGGPSTVQVSPMREVEQIGTVNSSQRNGSGVRLFVLHTEQGRSQTGNAQRLTNFLKNPNAQVSYHYSSDNDTCIALIDTDRASWSVLDANPYCINFCFAGSYAEQSREEWLSRFGKAIDMAAWLFVRDAAKYNPLEPVIRGWNELKAGKAGATDHRGITAMGIGNHTDVGVNFPWDVFAAAVTKYVRGVVIAPPPPNQIDIEAKQAAAWIGARQDKDGQKTRGAVAGKYVRFANAIIYWTPGTGAHAVPAGGTDAKGNPIPNILKVYADNNYEAGFLGFPVGDHSVLTRDGKVIGGVQGFEHGAIYTHYREDGTEVGYPVGGFIRELWNRSNYENGPYGFPTSYEIDYPGGKYQDFQNGRIVFPKRGAVGFLNSNGLDPIVPDLEEKKA